MLAQKSNQQRQDKRDVMMLRINSFPMLNQRQDSHLIHTGFLSKHWGTLYQAIKNTNSFLNSKSSDGSQEPKPQTSPQKVPTQAPDFVGDAGGNVVPIPAGSTARPSDNGNGVVYQPPVPAGSHPDADAVRVMGPTAAQPTGSITVHGPTGQPINPATGKPDTRANTHTPIVPVAPKPCSSGENGCSR